MENLQDLIESAAYSTDPLKQRRIILGTLLNYVQKNENFKFRAVVHKNPKGEDEMFMIYITDFNWERYLWVDMYENGELYHSSLEDCLLEEVLYASDDSPYCAFNTYKAIESRGEFINVNDDIDKYL